MKFTKEDSLRTKGVAVILLLFHHLFFADRGYPVELHLISRDTLGVLAVAARICVWIFCFISAYGITLQFNRKSEEQSIGKFVFTR